jgi:hypothetical protein
MHAAFCGAHLLRTHRIQIAVQYGFQTARAGGKKISHSKPLKIHFEGETLYRVLAHASSIHLICLLIHCAASCVSSCNSEFQGFPKSERLYRHQNDHGGQNKNGDFIEKTVKNMVPDIFICSESFDQNTAVMMVAI